MPSSNPTFINYKNRIAIEAETKPRNPRSGDTNTQMDFFDRRSAPVVPISPMRSFPIVSPDGSKQTMYLAPPGVPPVDPVIGMCSISSDEFADPAEDFRVAQQEVEEYRHFLRGEVYALRVERNHGSKRDPAWRPAYSLNNLYGIQSALNKVVHLMDYHHSSRRKSRARQHRFEWE
jgi:hypothetical protein